MQRLESTSPLDPSSFLSDKRHADVRIRCRDGEIPAHRFLLAASCPLLEVVMRGVDSPIPEEKTFLWLPDFTVAQVREFLWVVYGGKKEGISEVVALLLEMCCFQFIQGRRLPPMPVRDSTPPLPKRYYEEENWDANDYEPSAGDNNEAWKIPEGKKMDFEHVDVEMSQQANVMYQEELDMDISQEGEQLQQQQGVKTVATLATCKLNVTLPESNYSIQRDKETELFMCPVMSCEYALTSREYIVSHVNNLHRKIQCMLCEVKIRPKDMIVHRARCHRPAHKEDDTDTFDFDKGEGKYECKVVAGCPYKAKTQEALDRHKEAHTRVVCDYCGKVMPKENLERHKKCHTPARLGRFECVECNAQFSMEQEMGEHLSGYHHFVPDAIDTCIICKRVKGSYSGVEEHSKRCVPIPQKRSTNLVKRTCGKKTAHIEVPVDPEKPNNCPYDGCDYESVRPSKIKSHYLAYHVKQKCPYCEKILNFYHLERHVKIQHLKQYNHVCHVCSAGFHSPVQLKNHIDEEHIKELKYICEDCGKGFFSKKKMYNHKHHYHDNAGRWRCDPCGKVYQWKESLVKHFNAAHGGRGIKELYMNKDGKFIQRRKFVHVKDDDGEVGQMMARSTQGIYSLPPAENQ